MDARRAGFLVANVGAIVLLALLVLEPLPGDVYELARGEAPRAVVGSSRMVVYDAQNDTTLAAFGFWNHEPAGDALQFRGDVRPLLDGRRWIVEPEGGGPVTRERTELSLNDRTQTPYPDGDPDMAAGRHTVSPPMILEPVWPPLVGYAGAVAGLGVGLALHFGARWSALAPAVAAGLAANLARLSPFGAILVGIALVPACAIAALLLAPRRPQLGWALGCAAIAFAASAWLASHFAAMGGGEV